MSVAGGRLDIMIEPDAKSDLHRYLQEARDALVWKLEGLSEYGIRRPMTPTGTNLLGLVKHATFVEVGYFGDAFGHPFGEGLPSWKLAMAEDNVDMWATADESREDIVEQYRRVWAHADATIAELPLDTVGQVPWWPEERRGATLHHLLVRVLGDTQRHAGHADIVRELIDGSAGESASGTSLPPGDQGWWEEYRAKLERVARAADQR